MVIPATARSRAAPCQLALTPGSRSFRSGYVPNASLRGLSFPHGGDTGSKDSARLETRDDSPATARFTLLRGLTLAVQAHCC